MTDDTPHADERTRERLNQILDYLYGAGSLDGHWFGDGGSPPGKGRYWWRSELQRLTAALLAPAGTLYWATDPSYPCPTCGHAPHASAGERERKGWWIKPDCDFCLGDGVIDQSVCPGCLRRIWETYRSLYPCTWYPDESLPTPDTRPSAAGERERTVDPDARKLAESFAVYLLNEFGVSEESATDHAEALVEITIGRLVALALPSAPEAQGERKPATRTGLTAAYREAVNDPEYMADVREITAAFDGTAGDGLADTQEGE